MIPFQARIIPVGVVLLFVTTAALLFGALRLPPPRTIDVGAPGDMRFFANLFDAEQQATTTFRWSTSGSRLLLHAVYAGPLALDLRVHGGEAAASAERQLFVVRDGQVLAQLPVLPGWRVYRVLLPDGAAMQPLDLIVSSYGSAPRDPRLLGVPIDLVRVAPVAPVALPVGLPLRRALLLTGGLLLLGGLLWQLDRRVWPASTTSMRLGRAGASVAVAAAALLFWAQHDPYGLAWRLPMLAWGLALATLLLVAIWFVTRLAALPGGMILVPGRGWRVAGLTVLLAHLLLLAPLPVSLRGTAALLLLWLPGFLLAWLVFRHECDPLEKIFLGVCGGLALSVPLLLGLHALPGPLPVWLLLPVLDGLSLFLGWRLLRQARGQEHASTDARPQSGGYRPLLVLPALVLLGAGLRLAFLGGAEFQGDEGRALLIAAGLFHGQDEILLLHKKGPVEVLLPVGPLVLTGHMNEWVARLPFALAGIAVLPGVYLLARRLFGGDTTGALRGIAVGLLAAALLALDGFLIAFARVVQYQSVVVLLSLGALWCAWRVYQGAAHPRRYLVWAALLLAVGLLAHYDAVFVAPALAWLVLAGGRRRAWRGADWLRALAPPVLVGSVLLASFFVPFALHERFDRTVEYIVGRTGQDDAGIALFNNLIDYYFLATFYNTTYQVQVYAVVLLAGLLAWLWMYVRPPLLGGGLAMLLALGSLLLLLAPARFELAGGGNLAIVVFALPLAGLALAPATPAALRVLVIWFATAFVAEAFLIVSPKTHFYVIDTSAALLIGLALVRLVEWLRARRLPWLYAPLVAGGVGLLLLAVPYMYLVFVRQVPEYRTVFPAARPALYRAGYGDSTPKGSFFGFPRQAGWKVVGELYRRGVLQGDYSSNEKDLITGWYTRGTLRCLYQPDYYFAAWSVASSTLKIDVPPGYALAGSVLVDNVKKLDIYSRQAVDGLPRIYDLEHYRATFDRRPVHSFPIQRSLVEVVPQWHLDVKWQRDVLLRGYDLDRSQVQPGQTATLVLYWREHATIGPGYEPLVEVVDRHGLPVALAQPHCDVPPADWNTQYLSGVAYSVTADAQLPPGAYTLRVALRHTATGALLPLADGTTALPIAPLTVVSR